MFFGIERDENDRRASAEANYSGGRDFFREIQFELEIERMLLNLGRIRNVGLVMWITGNVG